MTRTADIETEDVVLTFAAYPQGMAICYWSPSRTGSWGADCQTGREAAIELARAIRDTGNPGLLMLVLSAIYATDRLDNAVEISFMTTIAGLMRRAVPS